MLTVTTYNLAVCSGCCDPPADCCAELVWPFQYYLTITVPCAGHVGTPVTVTYDHDLVSGGRTYRIYEAELEGCCAKAVLNVFCEDGVKYFGFNYDGPGCLYPPGGGYATQLCADTSPTDVTIDPVGLPTNSPNACCGEEPDRYNLGTVRVTE